MIQDEKVKIQGVPVKHSYCIYGSNNYVVLPNDVVFQLAGGVFIVESFVCIALIVDGIIIAALFKTKDD